MPTDIDNITFADDITIWTTNHDPDRATATIQAAINIISKWCDKWSLKISTQKTECTFFTRTTSLANYIPSLSLQGTDIRFNENPKLLGVVLDPKLRWAAHTEYVVNSCTSRLNALKAVASRNWGADTTILRNFYLAFVRSKATYCCEVWGGAAPTHINKVKAIQSAALRLCLGCTKTTAVASMEIELGVEPIELYIKRQTWIKFLKASTVTQGHPLYSICAEPLTIKNSFNYQVNLVAAALEHDFPEMIPPVHSESPRDWPGIDVKLDLPSKSNKKNLPDLLRAETLQMLNEHYGSHTKIFTDGSVDLEKGNSGAGYYIHNTSERFYVPANAQSSMDAELLAINAALNACMTIPERCICILTDSRSALEALSSLGTGAYNFRLAEIRKMIVYLNAQEKKITFQWVPSHCGVTGNEIADNIAKEACKMWPVNTKECSLLHCIRAANRYFRNLWSEAWQSATTGRSLFDIQPMPPMENIYKDVARPIATFLARARTGHIVTQQYLYRFNLVNSPVCELCEKEEESLEHILLTCQYPIAEKDILRTEVPGLKEILINRKYWARASSIYREHRAIGYS